MEVAAPPQQQAYARRMAASGANGAGGGTSGASGGGGPIVASGNVAAAIDATGGKHMMRMNSCIAFDCALEAGLRSEGCNSWKLLLEGQWQWLLQRFARQFGVRHQYVLLAHLR